VFLLSGTRREKVVSAVYDTDNPRIAAATRYAFLVREATSIANEILQTVSGTCPTRQHATADRIADIDRAAPSCLLKSAPSYFRSPVGIRV